MKAKPIRFCVECGKQHDTGVENNLTGEFSRIEKCIDCLMSKCSFNFQQRQITLDDLNGLSDEEIHKQFGLQSEYGSLSPVEFAKSTLYDSQGNPMNIKCKCGNEATSVIMGLDSYVGLCNKCQYGE